jgi:hypothetical protein
MKGPVVHCHPLENTKIQKSINKLINVDKSIRTEVAVKNKDKKEIVSETTQTHDRRN